MNGGLSLYRVRRGVFFCLFLLAPQVQAACQVEANRTATFGSVTSIQVGASSEKTSTLNAGLGCTGAVSTLQGTDHFYLTVTSSTAGLTGPGGDVISYTLFADSGMGQPIERGAQFDFTAIASGLGLVASASPRTVPLYLASLSAGNVAAGIYTENLNVVWRWDYCSSQDGAGGCTQRDTGTGSTVLTVTMTVTNDCLILAPTISFGSAPVASAFNPVTQRISIACTKDSHYSVGLDPGQHGIDGRRRMVSGDHFLAYDLYKGASAMVWGSQGADRRESTQAEINPGSGMGTELQVFDVTARVYGDQPTPPAGTYTDSVVVDIGF